MRELLVAHGGGVGDADPAVRKPPLQAALAGADDEFAVAVFLAHDRVVDGRIEVRQARTQAQARGEGPRVGHPVVFQFGRGRGAAQGRGIRELFAEAPAAGEFAEHARVVLVPRRLEGRRKAEEGAGIVPRHGRNALFADEVLAGFFRRGERKPVRGAGGGGDVEIERAAGHFRGESRFAEDFDERAEAARVVPTDAIGALPIGDARRGRFLNGLERAGIDVVLDGRERLDRGGVPRGEPEPPAGHVERLAHAVQFDGHFLAARPREDRKRRGLVGKGRVRGVLDKQDAVAAGEVDEFVEECRRRGRAGGVVRIVDVKKLDTRKVALFEPGEVGEEAVPRGERDGNDRAAQIFRVGPEHRIARHGQQHLVSRVHEGEREEGKRGLRADGVVDFAGLVDVFHAEKSAEVPRGGFAEEGDAVVRVPAVFGLVHGLLQGGTDGARGHPVRLADAEVEHFAFGMGGAGRGLGALDFLELVDFAGLPEGGAADALRKEVLEIHGCPFVARESTAPALPPQSLLPRGFPGCQCLAKAGRICQASATR